LKKDRYRVSATRSSSVETSSPSSHCCSSSERLSLKPVASCCMSSPTRSSACSTVCRGRSTKPDCSSSQRRRYWAASSAANRGARSSVASASRTSSAVSRSCSVSAGQLEAGPPDCPPSTFRFASSERSRSSLRSAVAERAVVSLVSVLDRSSCSLIGASSFRFARRSAARQTRRGPAARPRLPRGARRTTPGSAALLDAGSRCPYRPAGSTR
jgi:hypothetical protein